MTLDKEIKIAQALEFIARHGRQAPELAEHLALAALDNHIVRSTSIGHNDIHTTWTGSRWSTVWERHDNLVHWADEDTVLAALAKHELFVHCAHTGTDPS